MSKDQQSVELNGRMYDAKTGKLVAPAAAHKAIHTDAVVAPKQHTQHPGKNLDGVARKRATLGGIHTTPRHPERSKTLMRSVVKKPVVPVSEHKSAKATHDLPAKQHTDNGHIIIKTQHVIHASGVTRSALITKFGSAATVSAAPIPVQPSPTHHPEPITADAPPIATVTAPLQDDIDPIRQALENAPTHITPTPKKHHAYHHTARILHVRPSSLTALLVGIVTVATASYFTYKNIPQIALRVASERTGIKASIPTYSPAGYTLTKPVQYDSSQIRLQYASNSDDRSFDVVQKASSWDSKSLLENYVIPGGHQYQKELVNGRTVYLLDNGDATWVDGGTWYEVKANTDLNNDQLLKIIKSL